MKQARKKLAVKVSARRVRLTPPRHWKVGDVAKMRVEVTPSWPGSEPDQFEIGARFLIPLKSPRRRSA